jgi:hypothetical protein
MATRLRTPTFAGLVQEAEDHCDEEATRQKPNERSICLDHSTSVCHVINIIRVGFVLVTTSLVFFVDTRCEGVEVFCKVTKPGAILKAIRAITSSDRDRKCLTDCEFGSSLRMMLYLQYLLRAGKK